MMNAKTNTHAFHPNSLFLRTAVPLFGAVMIVIALGMYYTRDATRELYNYLSVETLKNDAFFARTLVGESLKRVQEETPGLSQDGLQIAVALDVSEQMLVLLNRPSTGLLLLDDSGKILLNTRSDKPAASLINISELMGNKAAFVQGSATKNGITLAHTYFQPLDVHIVVFNNQTFEQAPFYRGMASSGYVFASFLSVLMLVMIYIMLNIFVLRPVNRLSTTMREIVQQDSFEQNMTISGSNELAQVARLFNTLLHHLRDRDTKLRDHREKLEDMVAERTKKLLDMQERMVQQERLAAIGEFSSSIAHELRNPLTSIKMGIEQIVPLLDDMDSKSIRRMELVQAEVARLDSMLKGILAFAATTPTDITPLSLEAVLAQAQPTFDALGKDSKVAMDYVGFQTPCTIMADKNKLLQALINLVKNACEAHSGTKSVLISASYDERTAHIRIQNGGKPIPTDVMDRLFEPFFTTKTGGTGLGLPTTKRLIEEMGGEITLESTPALGTIATITLPLAKA
ncbi:MAG: HAMP domain-containing protein [Proteobacteria bacterium]|nr:HAMP domain-containing protein [Pseudomonadota bacterium]